MSTHGAKKKRLGSRRRVTNQNITAEDEFLVTDSNTVAQLSIPAENTDSVNTFSNPDNLVSQTQSPTSPELSGHRRKLGSSRRNKGGKHVKDLATESPPKPKEEVEEKTKGSGSPETAHMSVAIQPLKQEKCSPGSEHDVSGTHESLLCLSEELLNVHSVRGAESDDREGNTEVLRQDGNFQGNYLACESNAELADSQLSATTVITTYESSPTELTGIDFNTGQEAFLPPSEELLIKDEQNKIISLSEDAQHSYDVNSKVSEEEMEQTQMYQIDNNHASEIISGNPVDQAGVSSMHHSEFIVKHTGDTKPESSVFDDKQDEQDEKENFEAFDNNNEDHHVYDIWKPQTSDADGVDAKVGQVNEIAGRVDDNMKLTPEQMFHQQPEISLADNDFTESSLQMQQSGINTSFDSKPHDNYAAKGEHNTDLNPFGIRKKLGSSRRSKERQQVKDSDAKSSHKTTQSVEVNMSNDFKTEKVSLQIETAWQENSTEGTLEEMVDSETHQTEELRNQAKEIPQLLGLKDESSPEDHSVTTYSTEKATFASPSGDSSTTEEQRELYTLPEVEGAHQSEDAEKVVHSPEPVQMQDLLEIDQPSENVIQDATDYSEIVSGNLMKQEVSDTHYTSDFPVKTSDDSATRQEDSKPDDTLGEHSTKDNMETFNNRKECYDEKPQISDKERVDTALVQSESRVEDDIKLNSEQTDHFEKTELVETEESKSFQTLESGLHVSWPLQNDNSLQPTAELYQKPAEEDVEWTKDNEPPEAKIISSTEETAVIEKSRETTQEELNTFDTPNTEEVSNEVKDEAKVCTTTDTSELGSSNLHSSSTEGQKLIVISSMEAQDERLPNLHMATNEESKGTNDATKLFMSDVNLQDSYWMSESKSEDMDSLVVLPVPQNEILSFSEVNKRESIFAAEAKNAEKIEIMEEVPVLVSAEVSQDEKVEPSPSSLSEDQKLQISTSDLQRTESNIIPDQNILLSSNNKEDTNTGVTGFAEESSMSSAETTQGSPNYEERPESVNATQHQALESTEEQVVADLETEKSVEVVGALYSKDNLTEVHEQGQEVEQTHIQEIHIPSEGMTDDATESFDIISGNLIDHISDTYKPGLIEQSIDFATMQDNPNPVKNVLNTQEREGIRSDVEGSETSSPFVSQPQNLSNSSEEQTHKGFKPINRQQVNDSVPELFDEHKVNEELEITQTDRESQEELGQGSEYDITMPVTHDGLQSPTISSHTGTDLPSFIGINVQHGHDKSETDLREEEPDESVGVTLDGLEKNDTHKEDLKDALLSEEAFREVHDPDVEPEQMQEVPEIDNYSKNVKYDATEYSEKQSEELIAEAEDGDIDQSELTVKSSVDSLSTQLGSHLHDMLEEHPTKDINIQDVDQINNDLHVNDFQQISNKEREDTAPSQLEMTEGCVKSDIKPSYEQIGIQEAEGVFVEVEGGKSSSQALQPYHALNSQDQKNDNKQDTDLTAESCHRPTEYVFQDEGENKPLDTTKMSLTEENAMQEKSMDTVLEGTDTADTAWKEEVGNQGEDNAHDGTLVGELTILCASLTVDQQQCEQSFSMEMPEEELPELGYVSGTENREKDMEKELFSLDGELHGNYVVRDSALPHELSIGKDQPGNESTVEQAACSSSKGELSTNEEEKEHINLSPVRVVCHSENSANEIHKEPTQMQVIHEVTHSTVWESMSSVPTLQSEVNVSLDFEPQLINNSGNPLGNRRKLGSSRRNKRQQNVKDTVTETSDESKEAVLDKKSSDEAVHLKTQHMSTEKKRQGESEEHMETYLKFPMELGDDNENPDTILSQSCMDRSAIETTAIISSLGQDDVVKSNQDVTEEENIEPGNLSSHVGHDTVKLDLIKSTDLDWNDESDMQNTPCHDDIVIARSLSSEPLEQEDDYHDQNEEALSHDKDDKISVPHTNDAVVTVGHAIVDSNYTEADTSVDLILSGKDGVEGEFQDPVKKDYKAQDIMASWEITTSGQFSTTHNKADKFAPVDTSFKTEKAVDVGEQSGISTVVSAVDSQHETQGQTVFDKSQHLQEKFKQKKRKFGSSRRIITKVDPEEALEKKDEANKRESDFAGEAKNAEKIEIMEEVLVLVSAEVSQDEKVEPSPSSLSKDQKLQISTSDLQRTESNIIPDQNILLSSNNKEDTNTGVTEVAEESSMSSAETTQGSPNYEERPESVNATQHQALESAEEQVAADLETVKSVEVVVSGAEEMEKNAEVGSHESSSVGEGAENPNLEMNNSSHIFGSTKRRRKMGSTRKNLESKTQEEDLPEKQEVHIDVIETTTNSEDMKTNLSSGLREDEKQLHENQKDSESEQQKDKILETGESQLTPLVHQSSEGNSDSNSQPVETEHHLTPNYLPTIQSTSTKLDETSESASGGRRRKMGSNRKSRGHQNNENQAGREAKIEDTDNVNDSGRVTDGSTVTTTEEETLDLHETSEVEKTNKGASTHISTSEAGEDSQPASEKSSIQVTPAQHPNAKIHLGQGRQETISLAGNSREAIGNCYHVVMVGDSSVGKTSYMKRAQSGKFSLDLPASVGLDSCMWTVVVDGKPVVLQIWDTAGQERFHSITRQIFHKAQAFLLMYDITSSHSFSAVSYWASCIQDGAAENVTVLLLGNKSDHAERCVTTQEGETLAKEHNFEFMECSAATGENVVQSLETMARMLSQKADTREEATVLVKEPQKKKASGCC